MKELKSISETLNDPFFRAFVGKNIEDLVERKLLRPEPKKGERYKRDWLDRMDTQEGLNTQFFFTNLQAVWEGTSELNYETRAVIDEICTKAFHRTKAIYSSEKTEVKIEFNRFERIRRFMDLLKSKI